MIRFNDPAVEAWFAETAARLAAGEEVEFPRGLTWLDIAELNRRLEGLPKSSVFMSSREKWTRFVADRQEA